MVAMVGLVVIVGAALFAQRVGEMRRKRIALQSVAAAAQMAARMTGIKIADNLRNLFETPVLFYALCLTWLATQSATRAMLAAAWADVALRALHSAIHCTYNRVNHRFAAFAASFALLAWLWGMTAVRLQAAP